MKTQIIKGYIIAQSPIHSGGDEKTGSESLLRRLSYIIDGKRVEVPVLSGNAIRGVLRRELIADMLYRIDYKLESVKIYHMLFSGGMLETVDEKSSGAIDIGLKRQIRKTIPPIAVLGSSLGNQIFEGKLKINMALPICKELKEFLPDDLQIKPETSFYEFLDWTFTTRRDDLREERKEDEQATQMMVNFEVFAPGTPFYHEFVLNDANEVEEGVLARMLNLWQQKPYIGGKSAIGLGKLKLNYDYEHDKEEAYLHFLHEKKDEITAMLKELEETF
jgi:hypothetical protein